MPTRRVSPCPFRPRETGTPPPSATDPPWCLGLYFRLSDEVILGANTLQKWRIKLDLEHDGVIIDKRRAPLVLGYRVCDCTT